MDTKKNVKKTIVTLFKCYAGKGNYDNFMKISVYYYSSAGNTESIAKIIGKIALSHGHSVSCERITKKLLHQIEDDFDILGIGYPIHFREAP